MARAYNWNVEEIRVRYSVTEDGLVFQDALTFTPEEFQAFRAKTTAQKRAVVDQRFNAWKAIVTAPPAPTPEPVFDPEAAQAEIERLRQREAELTDALIRKNEDGTDQPVT